MIDQKITPSEQKSDESENNTSATFKSPFSLLKPTYKTRARSTPETIKERNTLKYGVIKDHYRVDSERRVVLPGVPKHEDDWVQESHDFFNLIVLVPICVLNGLNWNWDKLLDISSPNYNLEGSWTGEWFDIFWNMSFLYILIDLFWIIIQPSCVKSPGTIIKHHIATLIYMCLPHILPELRWCMGVCMSVEINTWLLIARRVFNKQGLSPWIISLPCLFSIRVKLISIFFYVTWIVIRCIMYPTLLPFYYVKWIESSEQQNGTYLNAHLLVIVIHTVLVALNFKWTASLSTSKIRYWRGQNNMSVSKGL